MADRFGISKGFGISLSVDGVARHHGMPESGSPEDAVEEWLSTHCEDAQTKFVEGWLERRLLDLAEDERNQDLKTRQVEITARWERLTKRRGVQSDLDATLLPDILRRMGVPLKPDPD